jgi:predicted dehydrogenase
LEVHGIKGTVVIEGDRAKVWVTKETSEHEAFGPSVTLGKDHELDEDPTAPFHVQHGLQIQDFTDAILEDRAPFVTGRAALEPLKVILAIYESSRRGGERVDLAELTA